MQPVQAAINSVVAGLQEEQLQRQAKKAEASHSQAVGQIAVPILNGQCHPHLNGKIGEVGKDNVLTKITSLDEMSVADIMGLFKLVFKEDDLKTQHACLKIILEKILAKDPKNEKLYLKLFDVLELKGNTYFADFLAVLSTSQQEEFLYTVMISFPQESPDYEAQLWKNLMRFPLDYDKSKWLDKIFKLVCKLRMNYPDDAFKVACRQFDRKSFISYCAMEMAGKLFYGRKLNCNDFRFNLEEAVESLYGRMRNTPRRDELRGKSSELFSNILQEVIGHTDDTVQQLQSAFFIPFKDVQKRVENECIKASKKDWPDHHNDLKYFVQSEMRDYVYTRLMPQQDEEIDISEVFDVEFDRDEKARLGECLRLIQENRLSPLT